MSPVPPAVGSSGVWTTSSAGKAMSEPTAVRRRSLRAGGAAVVGAAVVVMVASCGSGRPLSPSGVRRVVGREAGPVSFARLTHAGNTVPPTAETGAGHAFPHTDAGRPARADAD